MKDQIIKQLNEMFPNEVLFKLTPKEAKEIRDNLVVTMMFLDSIAEREVK